MPVQHASDDVLKSMRRGITNRATRELIATIKTRIPDIAMRTTLIVGYPNETDKDFDVLYDFVKDMQFHRLGVFTYSREDGTTAHILCDPVPADVKEERKKAIMELQMEISEKRNKSLLGKKLRILVDRTEDGYAVGRTEWDAPEIDQEVFVRNNGNSVVGNFSDVRIVDAVEYDLYAEAVHES
jgi:ribosomal protein S12 methylthiotransferase